MCVGVERVGWQVETFFNVEYREMLREKVMMPKIVLDYGGRDR